MNEFTECCCISNKEAHEILKEMEYEAKIDKWVSVKDRMPEKGVNVLVYGCLYSDRKSIDVGYVDKSGDFFYYNKDVTHWMPLPTPPKEDDAE